MAIAITRAVRVFQNRYAIVETVTGEYHVMSLVRGEPRLLQGIKDSTGKLSYSVAKTAGGYKDTLSQARLSNFMNQELRQNKIDPHSDLGRMIGNSRDVVWAGGYTPPRANAVASASAAELGFNGGFIIGSFRNNTVSFASNPKVHPTQADAYAEAERLATRNPGIEFVVVKAVASFAKASVVSKSFE